MHQNYLQVWVRLSFLVCHNVDEIRDDLIGSDLLQVENDRRNGFQ